MITEQICVDIVRALFHRSTTIRTTSYDEGEKQELPSQPIKHGRAPNDVFREFLPRYPLADVEAAIKWLEICNYVTYSGIGIVAPRMVMHLTDKGVMLAQSGQLENEERQLVYQEDPYQAFVARQFRDEDTPLFEYLRDSVLARIGVKAIDGRVDGIEAFRGEIVRKIQGSRFFICILTRREKLLSGDFASSVWLYQETGAAVALGKKPLILVERGISEHFAGELQKAYEYTPFERATYKDNFHEIGRRLEHDLRAHHIPLRMDTETDCE